MWIEGRQKALRASTNSRVSCRGRIRINFFARRPSAEERQLAVRVTLVMQWGH